MYATVQVPLVGCSICRKEEPMPCGSYTKDIDEGAIEGVPSGLPKGWVDFNRSEFMCPECLKKLGTAP